MHRAAHIAGMELHAEPHFVYVLALLFTPDRRRVVLMRKTRPAWQAGRVNALGGTNSSEPGPKGVRSPAHHR